MIFTADGVVQRLDYRTVWALADDMDIARILLDEFNVNIHGIWVTAEEIFV